MSELPAEVRRAGAALFPLDDLCLVNKTENGTWHWQKRGDFEFWVRRGQEKWFWNSLWNYASLLEVGGGCWLTRAQSRNEAIKNIKEKKATYLVPEIVMRRLIEL